MLARTESKASRTLSACGPPSGSTIATRASWIFPPKALPRMINCTRGKIIDASISAGERKNLRISRSTMAIIRFITYTPACSWLQPRPLRHHERVGLLQFVAQLSPGVVNENVVKRCVLNGKRLHRHLLSNCEFDELGGGARSVAGENAVHARAFVLH